MYVAFKNSLAYLVHLYHTLCRKIRQKKSSTPCYYTVCFLARKRKRDKAALNISKQPRFYLKKSEKWKRWKPFRWKTKQVNRTQAIHNDLSWLWIAFVFDFSSSNFKTNCKLFYQFLNPRGRMFNFYGTPSSSVSVSFRYQKQVISLNQ